MSSMRSASSSTSIRDPLQREGTSREEILQAAGSGDKDVRALRPRRLRRDADAAVDGGDPQALGCCEVLELGHDLGGELTRGGQHQSTGCRSGLHAFGERDTEGERLTRAGRRLDKDVVPGEHILQDELLDRERCRYSTAGQGTAHGTGHAEIGERLLGHLLLLTALAGACGSEALADPNRSWRDSSELTSRPKDSTAVPDGNRRSPAGPRVLLQCRPWALPRREGHGAVGLC